MVWSTVSPAPSQTPPADPVIRVSVNLVQIDAVVTDSKGRHIAGLTADDFQLLEDDKPQKITHLSYLDATPPVPSAGNGKHSGSEAILAPSRKPKRDEIRRRVMVLLDDVHTTTEDMMRLLPAAKKFVAEQVQPGDLVSIAAVRGGMGFYEQFTSDRAILNAAMDKMMGRTGGSYEDTTGGAADCLRAQMLFDAVMGKLSWGIQSLNQLPGRKAIVLFSDGLSIPRQLCSAEAKTMTESMQRTADLSNRSGVAIYVIDSRGITPGQATAGDRFDQMIPGEPIPFGNSSVIVSTRNYQTIALQETSDFLASQTGGIFYHNTNGFSDALAKSMDDMGGYYLIGFQPARNDFELKNGVSVYHKVQLKLVRTRLNVRHGRGFLGVPDAEPAGPPTRERMLVNALESPFDSGGIRLRLTPLYSAPAPGASGERRPTTIRALLAIDGRDLHLADWDDGRKKVVLDVVAAAYAADYKLISHSSQEYMVSVKPEERPKLAASGVTYQMMVEIPKSGAYQIRAAVRDGATGLIGSANSLVIVPDFERSQISVSSVVLSDPATGDELEQAAAREFHPGTSVAYGCEVYGAKSGLEIEIRLFRDGARVFASAPIPIPLAPGLNRIPVVGHLNLPVGMAPGDYQFELIARDPRAPPKQQPATQWTDLTLVAQ